jgi:hypothetical protein
MRKICFIVSAAIRIAILRRLAAQRGPDFTSMKQRGWQTKTDIITGDQKKIKRCSPATMLFSWQCALKIY